MKKLLYLLLALPIFALTSCSDDDKLPRVDMDVEVENATNIDGTLYVVQGDTLIIKGITVSSPDAPKGIALGGVTYILNYEPVYFNPQAPYSFEIDTNGWAVGTRLLQMQTNVYAVDYSPMYAWITFPLKVVASQEDIPGNSVPEGGTFHINPDVKAQ